MEKDSTNEFSVCVFFSIEQYPNWNTKAEMYMYYDSNMLYMDNMNIADFSTDYG